MKKITTTITFLTLVFCLACSNQNQESLSSDFYVTNFTLMEINEALFEQNVSSINSLLKIADDSTKSVLVDVNSTTEESLKKIAELEENLISACGGYDDFHSPVGLKETTKVTTFFIQKQNGVILKQAVNQLAVKLRTYGYNYKDLALDIEQTPYFKGHEDFGKLKFEEFLFRETNLEYAINHLELLITKVLTLQSSFLNSVEHEIITNDK